MLATDPLLASLGRAARQLDPHRFPHIADFVAPAQRGDVVIDQVMVVQTRLWVGGQMVMSDSTHEARTNREVLFRSRGRVMIAGLGLGYILHPILRKPSVTQVTVIEKNPDVIALVAPTLKSPKLHIVEADIFKWRPPRGTRYQTIYFDVWPNLSVKNLPDMDRLHRAFRSYRAAGGWVGSWCHDECKARRDWPIVDEG